MAGTGWSEMIRLRESLEKEQQRLRRSIYDLHDELVWVDNLDEADLAGLVAYEERKQTLVEINHRMLEQVNRALERVDAGTYGACDRCGREIPTEQLEALPCVALCAPCQQGQVERRLVRW